ARDEKLRCLSNFAFLRVISRFNPKAARSRNATESIMKTIAVLGTLDSKGEEHAFVADLIRQRGHGTLLIDTGSGAPPAVTPDISREEVAAAAGIDLAALVARQDRGECVSAMAKAAPVLLAKLVEE